MSQTELYEITCVKHQQTAQVSDPASWICPICKEKLEHPFRKVNHCDCGHVWVGDPGCPKCKLADIKRRVLRRLPTQQLIKEMVGSDSSVLTMEKKRIAKLELEKKVKESTLKLPELLTELITEIKGLREDLKHV